MNYRTLRLKIITGYAILAIVLVFAAQMVYDSTRSLTDLNNASERLMERLSTALFTACLMLPMPSVRS